MQQVLLVHKDCKVHKALLDLLGPPGLKVYKVYKDPSVVLALWGQLDLLARMVPLVLKVYKALWVRLDPLVLRDPLAVLVLWGLLDLLAFLAQQVPPEPRAYKGR